VEDVFSGVLSPEFFAYKLTRNAHGIICAITHREANDSWAIQSINPPAEYFIFVDEESGSCLEAGRKLSVGGVFHVPSDRP
jgi:hypothetical protein